MLNYLWEIMLILGIGFGIITGVAEELGTGILESSTAAVELVIYMCGIVGLWSGFMKVAEKSGLIKKITKLLSGIISFLYPDIPKGSKACEYIAMNMTANILGLGWAATPSGILAMKELKSCHEEHCQITLKRTKQKGRLLSKRQLKSLNPDSASNAMCTFLIINISSLQLIPVNIIAYRSKYGSVNPAAIVGAGLFATLFSTLIGILYARIMHEVTAVSE